MLCCSIALGNGNTNSDQTHSPTHKVETPPNRTSFQRPGVVLGHTLGRQLDVMGYNTTSPSFVRVFLEALWRRFWISFVETSGVLHPR